MKHKQRSIIPKSAAQEVNANKAFINREAAILKGWKQDGNTASVLVSFRFIQHDYECFSDWTKEQMNIFWGFLRNIHQVSWQTLFNQGGRGQNKAGFALTYLPRDKYPNGFMQQVDPLIEFFEVRVNQKMRVHGFRDDSIYYLCYLDKDHQFCPD